METRENALVLPELSQDSNIFKYCYLNYKNNISFRAGERIYTSNILFSVLILFSPSFLASYPEMPYEVGNNKKNYNRHLRLHI